MVASVGCVVERTFEIFVFFQTLGWRSSSARVPSAWIGTTGKPHSSGIISFSWGDPDVRRSVVAGPMWKAIRLHGGRWEEGGGEGRFGACFFLRSLAHGQTIRRDRRSDRPIETVYPGPQRGYARSVAMRYG